MNKRIRALQEKLRKDGLDGAIYSTGGNMQYFLDDVNYSWQRTMYTGFVFPEKNGDQIYVPDCILYIPTEDEPVLINSYERAKDMKHISIRQQTGFFCRINDMLQKELKGSRFACGESGGDHLVRMIKAIKPEAEIRDGEAYGRQMRAIKDEKEIQALRKVAAFTDQAMGKIVECLQPGITNMQVQDYVGQVGFEAGCVELPFPPTVRFYHTQANEPFQVDGYPTMSTLRDKTSISFDFGYVMDGYCSDFGRSFYCGKASDKIRDGYRYLQEAQVEVIERIKPGDPMTYGFKMIEEYLAKHGYDDYLRHYYDFNLLGHQLGIEVHEGPWLHEEQEEVFKPGMVFTVEPKFWWDGQCFTRVEDMVLITQTGTECLTNFSRERFEL